MVKAEHVDVLDVSSVTHTIEGADVVLNATGLTYESLNTYEQVHITGSKNVSHAAHVADVPTFIHFSTMGTNIPQYSRWAVSKMRGDVRRAREAIAALRAEWATSNVIAWRWERTGDAADFVRYELATGPTPTAALLGMGGSQLFGPAQNPELGHFTLPRTGADDRARCSKSEIRWSRRSEVRVRW